MSGFQSPITIGQVLERVSSKEILLPSFQREFEWSTEQIQNLFDSIMKGYPFSSMLFWKVKGNDKNSYKFSQFVQEYRSFYHTYQKSENCSKNKDFHAVLDGQQRITALFIGFRGSYAYKGHRQKWSDDQNSLPDRKLYLNLTTQTEEGNYQFDFFTRDESENFSEFKLIDDDHWFNVGFIEAKKSLRDHYKGTAAVSLSDKEIECLEKLHDTLNQRVINYYEIDESDYQEAVDIFIRINSGGTSLTKSKIMFSMVVATWDDTLDAKQEFSSLIKDVSDLGFNIDNDFILKAVLFLFHKNIKFDINSFNEKFLIDIRDNRWKSIKECIVELFELLESFQLNNHTLTSNLATLPILYYIYHKNIYNSFYKKVSYSKERAQIKRWLFAMLVRQVFGGSSDNVLTQARSTFTSQSSMQKKIYFSTELSEFPAKKITENIRKVSNIDDDFIEELLKTQKDNRYAFSILSLLYPQLNYNNGEFHKDHLHPTAKYTENLDWSIYNSILNLQLIDDSDNTSKQDKDLEDWVEHRRAEFRYTREEFLTKQLIPNVDLGLNNFDDFIEARKRMLIEKLKELLN